jgi:uncharacterized protein YeaO (DUF488 family)
MSTRRPAIKRVFESPAASDGTRILADRLWPRGVSKAHAAVDLWLKEIAPSAALRTWFGHDPLRWEGFREKYLEELSARPTEVAKVRALMGAGVVTLLFAAHDVERNNAVVLAEYLSVAS